MLARKGCKVEKKQVVPGLITLFSQGEIAQRLRNLSVSAWLGQFSPGRQLFAGKIVQEQNKGHDTFISSVLRDCLRCVVQRTCQ